MTYDDLDVGFACSAAVIANDTLPDVFAPPLAPQDPREEPELSTEQWRFLWLHVRQVVVRWQWHFKDTVLRAHAEHGDTATISLEAVRGLVDLGLMRPMGAAGYALTAEGIRVGT